MTVEVERFAGGAVLVLLGWPERDEACGGLVWRPGPSRVDGRPWMVVSRDKVAKTRMVGGGA